MSECYFQLAYFNDTLNEKKNSVSSFSVNVSRKKLVYLGFNISIYSSLLM